MAEGRFRKAGFTLGLNYIGEHALLFLRTVLVARFLGPEYFGISVTFVLVVSTFALISDLGIEKYLIQAREEDVPATMPTLASVLLLRGLLLGLVIFLLSGWIAARFGHPDLGWFYACAAIIPVIEGFRNLDPLLQQRQMRYEAYVKVQLGGLLPGVLLTILLAAFTREYVAIAVGCLLTSVISVMLSHLLARSPYRLGMSRAALGPVLSYGWPLLLNGIVIFLGTQGDRIVIGSLNGMRDLAGYVAVSALTGGASIFLARLAGNLYLPLLSETRDDLARYGERCRTTGAASLLLLSAILLPMAMIGGPIVALLFGEGYRAPPLLVAFLAVQSAAMVLRAWSVVISLSLGGTSDILTSNILRIVGLAGAFVAVSSGHGVTWVAGCMCAGDVAATLLALWQAGRRSPAARATVFLLGVAFCAMAALALGLSWIIDPYAGLLAPLAGALAAGAPGVIFALLISADLRQRIGNLGMRLVRKVQ